MATALREDKDRDLGFGARVAQQAKARFLNQDGSFNVIRTGLPFWRTLSAYHALLTMSWLRFFVLITFAYFAVNVIFAGAYLLCGPDALSGRSAHNPHERMLEDFFFSVQTLATIGYGSVAPKSLAANVLVTVEALFGLMGLALATGLMFARFSRPNTRIAFSEKAVVAPFRDGAALMFRIVNERSNQLTDVQATVNFSRLEGEGAERARRFYELSLDRRRVLFMPLHWVVVHPIDEASPLRGLTREELESGDSEVMILLTAMDETFFQTIHVRSSYKPAEIAWGHRFADMFLRTDDGLMGIDLRKLHDIEPAPLRHSLAGLDPPRLSP